MAFFGRKAAFDNGTEFISIIPLFGTTEDAEVFAEIAAGVGIMRDGGIGFPAFVVTIGNPSIAGFAALGADEFKAQAAVFALAFAVGDKSLGIVFGAAREAGRINGDGSIGRRGIALVQGDKNFFEAQFLQEPEIVIAVELGIAKEGSETVVPNAFME